ncbi:MAG: hypothetical protein ACJAXJ_002286 [Colwellia sp.]|jgi:hypothetical protein
MNINSVMLLIKSLIMVAFIIMVGSGSATSRDNIAFEQPVDTEKWLQVSDTILAYSRGGFILPNGVIVDISFEKRIFRNGEETSSSYFETPSNLNLVKNGKLNIPGVSNTLFQSIVQNDLDNQTLQTINNINIDIKNLNNNLTPSNNQFYNLHALSTAIN